MRFILALTLILSGNAALAHVGHVAEVAGHDHWVAGAVIGIAVVAGLYGALKGRKDPEQTESETAEEEVPA